MKKVEDAIEEFEKNGIDSQESMDKLMQTFQAISNNLGEAEEAENEEIYFLDEHENSMEFEEPAYAEYKITRNKKVTNPTETWDYAHKVNYIVPFSLRGTVNAIKYAESEGLKVKAIGSRHSFSDILHTKDCYIDLSRAHPYQPKRQKRGYTARNHNKAVRKLDQSALGRLSGNSEFRKKHIDVPGGMKIHALNRILYSDKKHGKKRDKNRFGNKRLFNMGAGDVQAFAGAFSTGTHGTGGEYSTYHDAIRSVLIVGSYGKVYRVEPNVGITNRVRHERYYRDHPNEVQVELKNSDDLFYSLIVSMGCFGIIYSTIIELKEMTLLKETGEFYEGTAADKGWGELKKKVNINILPTNPKDEKFLSIGLNPYALKGNKSQSANLKVSVPTTERGKTFREKNRKIWPGWLANLGVAAKIIRLAANNGKMPKGGMIESALKSIEDNSNTAGIGKGRGKGYTDIAYKIWNAGTGKVSSIGTGIEFAFPIDKVVPVVDDLLDFLEKEGKTERGYYINAPMSLRFLRPSKAYLAFNGQQFKGQEVKLWCAVEILRVNSYNEEDDARERKLFHELQKIMMMKGGRPHWGLNFNFEFSRNLLKELYPKLKDWTTAYAFFNSNGTFDNKFTDACGFRSVSDDFFV